MTRKPRPLIFGEVLFDRFPDGREVLGGAPFNVAWNLRGIGLDPLLISAVGDDDRGRKVLDAMGSWGLDRAGVQVRASHETGTVEVKLDGGEPVFDIVAGRAWDEISAADLPPLPEARLVYHGTLASRQETSRMALETLLRRTQAPVLVDINLRAPWWSAEQVVSMLTAADLLKMNEAELAALVPDKNTLVTRAMELIKNHQPDLLCVTRGAAGAVAFAADRVIRTGPPEEDTRVLDTVGAGDAFASILVAGRLQNWPLELTLSRAQALASAVVGLRGATTEDAGFYRHFRKEWRLP